MEKKNSCAGCIHDLSEVPCSEWCDAVIGDYCPREGKIIGKRNAEEGTYNGETTYCPVNGWDCPYYKEGICHIEDPMEDCDDWGACFESWEEWEEL